jgi:leucyl aminopeptidase
VSEELEVRVEEAEPAGFTVEMLVLPRYEGDVAPGPEATALDARLGGRIRRILEDGDFKGKRDETMLLYANGEATGPERVLLVGVGKREDFGAAALRRAVGVAVGRAQALGVTEMAVAPGRMGAAPEGLGPDVAARAVTEAATLAAWSFRELKTEADEQAGGDALRRVALLGVWGAAQDAVQRAAAYAVVATRAENLARELATWPGNMATPTYLAERARELGGERGFSVTVMDRDEMEREGMHALLAVAQGSEEPPRFIIMEHRPEGVDGAPLVLVGKGVTFDAGGISLKPAAKMEEMKYDMSGAAAVIATMGAVAELGLPINVVGLVPSTENLPSGTAVKPGDVIRSRSGKTIEVVNTDAEGRLILADALAYGRGYTPAAMVDIATLTGAVVIALGHHAIGLMGNDGAVIDEVRAAGQRAGERCWPLPLWDEYREQLNSDVADIKNTGGRPAGSITAGWFLRDFVGDTPWAHLDIAGTAWGDDLSPPLRRGATGVPTRLLVEWVRARSER